MKVIIVWGPPAGGKTTYVRRNKGPNDIVVDLDLLKQAVMSGSEDEARATTGGVLDLALSIRDHVYRQIAGRKIEADTAWIIAGLPCMNQRELLAKRLNATDVVYIEATEQECMERMYGDESRTDKALQTKIIRKWFDEFKSRGGMSGLDQFMGPVEVD